MALLHDREAETLADWLRAHPSVTIIAHDRLKAYRDGADAGAPQATQVADRFHLLQNLAEALDTPYKERILKCWNAGCREALQLFRDLRRHGYTGSYPTVARYARRLRQAQGVRPREPR